MGEVGSPGVETVGAVEFGVVDGVIEGEKGVAEAADGFELGERLNHVGAVLEVLLGFAGSDAEIERGGEWGGEFLKGVEERGVVPPERAGLTDDLLESTRSFAGDEGGGEAGVAEADERAGADVSEGGVAVDEPGEEFVGDERGEGWEAGAFAPARGFAVAGDEDEPGVGEFGGEGVEDFGGADAFAIPFAVEEDSEVAGAGGVARLTDPEEAFVVEMSAVDRGGGFGHGARR